MAKKRGSLKHRVISKRHAMQSKRQVKHQKKTAEKTQESPKPLKESLHELEILAEERKVEQKVNGMEKKENEIEKKESQIIAEEKKVEKETEQIEKIEKEIRKEVASKPLSQLTLRDINKGIIGAFIGVVAHFAFIYGRQIAKDLTMPRAVILIMLSYALIVMMMYETGYRDVKEKRILGILPKRATAIYATSLIVIPVIFYLFNQLNLSDPADLFKQIAVSSVFASIGAGTADLIGKN